MANNTIQQIADNLGVVGYDDSSLLIGIADYYGVNTNNSKCLMFDILEAQGGDAANSKNYMEDLVAILGGSPNSLNVIEAWEAVTSGPAIDSDAQAFITAAAITDPTQQSAINTLVIGLKADNLWNKMLAIYPIVGGTASQHKYNLKDPQDLDAAFRLTFNGGITHSANGMLPNGVNGYADTFYYPFYNIANADSNHFSAYFRTNDAGPLVRDMGCNIVYYDGDEYTFGPGQYMTRFFGGYTYFYNGGHDAQINFIDPTTLGLYLSNRNLTNSTKAFKNSVLKSAGPISSTGLSDINFYLLGENTYNPDLSSYNISYGKRQLAFATLGDGLTDSDSTNLYTRIQAFQTTLSRQV